MYIQASSHTCRHGQSYRQEDREEVIHAGGKSYRQTGRHSYRQARRHVGSHTGSHIVRQSVCVHKGYELTVHKHHLALSRPARPILLDSLLKLYVLATFKAMRIGTDL